MNAIFTYMLTYGVLLIIFLGLVQFLTNGFFFKFMNVKASRGKKLLVEVRSKLQTYPVVGVIKEGYLIYKDNVSSKSTKRIMLDTNAVYRKFNVYCVNVDEEHNFIMLPDGNAVTGFDPIKFENFHVRALQSGETIDLNKFLKILIGVVIITLLAVLILHYRLGEISKIVEAGIQVSGVV